jgi:DNA-directed RNA polymerase subunit H (RpoH/RPB5)
MILKKSKYNYESIMETQAIKVLSELVTDREYIIEYIKNFDDNKEEFPFCLKARRGQDSILCFLNDDEKLNIQGIKDTISIMNKENANKCIIVYRSNVTSSAKKSLETLEYEFELFAMHELQLNITKHRLVPKHNRVTQSEKDELDKNYKGKLPILLSNDPVCRYYGFKKGEYIRITRKDGSIMYRVVK